MGEWLCAIEDGGFGCGLGDVSTASGVGEGGAFPVTGSEGKGRRFGMLRGPVADVNAGTTGAVGSGSAATGGFALTAGFSGLGRLS